MEFQDKENLSDLEVFGNEVYFNEKATFFGNIDLGGNLSILDGNLIIKSDNGTQYKIVVSNFGVLSTTPL